LPIPAIADVGEDRKAVEVARIAAKAVPIAAADTAFNLFLLVARLPRFIPVDVFMVIVFSFYYFMG
jgi:hypothetical protein